MNTGGWGTGNQSRGACGHEKQGSVMQCRNAEKQGAANALIDLSNDWPGGTAEDSFIQSMCVLRSLLQSTPI